MVTATSPAKIVAILDWEQACWFPDYWEYCKARYTTEYEGEWRDYIDTFLHPDTVSLEAFDFYTNALGRF